MREKKIKRLNKCRKKQTMHQIMLRDLKFLRYWWSCLTCSVTFCWFTLHETLILLSCCVFIEMVNCLNTIILKSFVIIVFTSILHLFYRTIIPTKICTTHIFLSIEFSILLLKISFCFQTGDKIVIYVSTRGHWDCTTLQHHCTAFGFASGYTEVLQGGTISMPMDRHVDNL